MILTLVGGGAHRLLGTVRSALKENVFAGGGEIRLYDLAKRRAQAMAAMIKKSPEYARTPVTVKWDLTLEEALDGADLVSVTLLAGGARPLAVESSIAASHGFVGSDNISYPGAFLALRGLPIILNIARAMEKYCPNAVFLNYTNPMAMLCRAIQEAAPEIVTTGLCHSVQGGIAKFASILNIPKDEISYLCAGINHLAFYLKLEHNGEDLYPALRKITLENQAVYDEDIVRNEMFLAMGYYVTESSGHFSEYSPWFRKREDTLQKYCYRGTSWNTGRTNFTIECREKRVTDYEETRRKALTEPVDLKRGQEYASSIFNAIFGDHEMFKFNGNVRNYGLIDNLPVGACVEVPVLASQDGLQPMHVGAIPDCVLPLMCLSSQIEEMAVKAHFTGDRDLIYQAICYDPITSAVLDLREIRKMVDELFAFSKPYLPQFKL